MSKFNTATKAKRTTTNVAGMPAYARENNQQELVSVVLNSMMKQDSYYESEEQRINHIFELVNKEQSEEFLMKLYVYTRTIFNLRSVSHVLAVALLDRIKGDPDFRIALQMGMVRPDDATEIVALWNLLNSGKMIPNALRKAIKFNLENKWSAYQLKKYFGNGHKVKVPDLIKLAHPAPKSADDEYMFKQAMEGTLPNIETVQTVNASTTDGDERAATYINMMIEHKLGVMGALKNVTKMFSNPELHNQALSEFDKLISSKKAVKRSQVLPFRFAQAYEAVYDDNTIDGFVRGRILEVIDNGFANSFVNLNLVEEGKTVAMLLDESGSMGNGQASPFYQGKVMLASMMAGLPSASSVSYLWAESTHRVSMASPMMFVKTTQARGWGTNLAQAVAHLMEDNFIADVMIIFTDMQENQVNNRGGFKELANLYRQKNPNTKFVFWNLQGYGAGTPMKLSDNVLEVAGFSERMLQLIPLMLKDKDGIIKDIMAL